MGGSIEQAFVLDPPNKMFSRQAARNGPSKQGRFARAACG
jgi:hypothetical protein